MPQILTDHSAPFTADRILTTTLDDFVEIAKAFSSDLRIAMFKRLLERPMSVGEIADLFQIPPSTAAVNIKKLEDAGLIRTELVPGTRGTQKLCAAVFSRIVVDTRPRSEDDSEHYVLIPMPVGHFFDSYVTPTCGIVSETSIIGEIDDPRAFYEPDRIHAQLLWFRQG
ncbi:MAG: helix-turn-helix domain-containing protein, partial [Alicyclobacillus sp.]|nr:helix-turn-helix domain-containing protein [Alicyclobacillus sp.]